MNEGVIDPRARGSKSPSIARAPRETATLERESCAIARTETPDSIAVDDPERPTRARAVIEGARTVEDAIVVVESANVESSAGRGTRDAGRRGVVARECE